MNLQMKLHLASMLGAATLCTGCVTSKVEQLRQSGSAVKVAAGETLVVLGRRHRGDRESEASFNSCVANALRNRQLPVYPEKGFVDALFPWLEPRTAPISSEAINTLFDDPAIVQRVRATGVRFMVWIDGETEKLDSGGSMGCALSPAGGGCFGFGWWEKESKYEVSIWDMTNRAPVGKITVNASGTSYMPAVIIPIPLIARTESAACDGVAGQVGELLTPAGGVKARPALKRPADRRRNVGPSPPYPPERPRG
ncbi:MAG: hypothetical protein ACT4PZ_21785 [Panacagrimonas sp.]